MLARLFGEFKLRTQNSELRTQNSELRTQGVDCLNVIDLSGNIKALSVRILRTGVPFCF